MIIRNALKDRFGASVLSVILGLGLAAMFRRVCKDGRCVVMHAPNPKDVAKYYYKMDDDCYKYTPHVVPCPSDPKAVLAQPAPKPA